MLQDLFNPYSIFAYAQRYYIIEAICDFLVKTGQPFVCFWDGKLHLASEIALDDPGLFYYIPLLVKFFGISPALASQIFYYGILGASSIVSLIAFYLLFRSIVFLLYGSVLFLFLVKKSVFYAKCVYVSYLATVLLLVPLLLWFIKRRKNDFYFIVFIGLAGLGVGFFHTIRFLSGIGTVVLIVTAILIDDFLSLKSKICLLCIFSLGILLPIIHMHRVVSQAESYLVKIRGHYSDMPKKHPFWHTIYASFGFCKNDLGIYFSDRCVADVVSKINPNVLNGTNEYESIVKNEIFKLIKDQPLFVCTTLFAKFGVCFLLFLICANIGFFSALLISNIREQIPFILSLGAATIHGLVSDMTMAYMIGFTALSFVYGLYFLFLGLNSVGFLFRKLYA